MFQIIFTIGSNLVALGSQVGNITRMLIAAGIGRARISALWAAWLATWAKAINEVARSRIREQITIVNYSNFNLYDNVYEHSISFNYAGQQLHTVLSKSLTPNLSQSAVLNAAVYRTMGSPLGSQMINTVKQEKLGILQNLCSGLPAAVVAFFLGTPPAGAEDCFPNTGYFTERVYGFATSNAVAKLSPSGLWQLQPLQVDLKIDIGKSIENMDPQIYNEFLAWKNSLNVNQVLDEITSQGTSSGINYWSEITNQANDWINALNSGQVQPSGGISITGNVTFQNGTIIVNNATNTQINSKVSYKNLRVEIGYIDKQTNVLIAPMFPCEEYSYSCSSADMVLKSPFYNCKGFIVINNGEPDAFGFSMGNADTSSSAPTLSSLLVPVVVNGKLIQGSSLAQAYGYFYTNEEQITGTSPFWVNQAGSIQERFFLCAT
jgi:hypothetical protein